MPDVVVTVSHYITLDEWLAERDLLGLSRSDTERIFPLYGKLPDMQPGDRVYFTYRGKLRGYLPFARVETVENRAHHLFFGRFALIGRGEIVAVTVPEPIQGFARWRYRWWDRKDEKPFPDWQKV
ncbi:MAG: hypothetical protein WCF84_03400 [Anaerolineae bacterium]